MGVVLYLVLEPAHRCHCNIVHGTSDGRFLLPWKSKPGITKHELRSGGFLYFLYVFFPSGIENNYNTFNR